MCNDRVNLPNLTRSTFEKHGRTSHAKRAESSAQRQSRSSILIRVIQKHRRISKKQCRMQRAGHRHTDVSAVLVKDHDKVNGHEQLVHPLHVRYPLVELGVHEQYPLHHLCTGGVKVTLK